MKLVEFYSRLQIQQALIKQITSDIRGVFRTQLDI